MTGKEEGSHVMRAMGVREEEGGGIRFSFSRETKREEARYAAEALKRAVEKLRVVQGGGVGRVRVYRA